MVVVSGGRGDAWTNEMTIRRKMAAIFNKTREHFPTLKDYNDYLEEVEDMTFNLIEGIDVQAIDDKIARYQQENAEQIILSRAKRAEDLAAALRASRMNPAKTEADDMCAGAQRRKQASRLAMVPKSQTPNALADQRAGAHRRSLGMPYAMRRDSRIREAERAAPLV